jgi:hypothetical protein
MVIDLISAVITPFVTVGVAAVVTPMVIAPLENAMVDPSTVIVSPAAAACCLSMTISRAFPLLLICEPLIPMEWSVP